MTKVDLAVDRYVEWIVNVYNKTSTAGTVPELSLMESRFMEAKAGLNQEEREDLNRRVYCWGGNDLDPRLHSIRSRLRRRYRR